MNTIGKIQTTATEYRSKNTKTHILLVEVINIVYTYSMVKYATFIDNSII